MALPLLGQISANDVNLDRGAVGTAELNCATVWADYYYNAFEPGNCYYTGQRDFADWYGAAYVSDCFIAGTKVLMGDRTEKNIEDVKVGDLVLSYDYKNERFKQARVQMVLDTVHSGVDNDHTIKIDLDTGAQLHCTNSNPFWIDGWGWCAFDPSKCKADHDLEVKQLQVGQHCIDKNGDRVKILAIEEVFDEVKTHSLRVKPLANFIANGVVAHNKCIHGDGMVETKRGVKVQLREIKAGDRIRVYKKGRAVLDTVKKIERIDHYAADGYSFTGGHKILLTGGHPILSPELGHLPELGYCSIDPELAKEDYGLSCKKLRDGDRVVSTGGDVSLVNVRSIHPRKKDSYILQMTSINTIIVNDLVLYSGISFRDQGNL